MLFSRTGFQTHDHSQVMWQQMNRKQDELLLWYRGLMKTKHGLPNALTDSNIPFFISTTNYLQVISEDSIADMATRHGMHD
jgi:hypothetical protein